MISRDEKESAQMEHALNTLWAEILDVILKDERINFSLFKQEITLVEDFIKSYELNRARRVLDAGWLNVLFKLHGIAVERKEGQEDEVV